MEYPPELILSFQEARERWSRHGYLICKRAMVEIDAAIDAMNEYRDLEAGYGD